MLALFVLCSQEGWPDIMYAAVDAKGEGVAPQIEYNPGAAYFFIAYMLISSIFFINLVSGVIFEKFAEVKQSESSLASLILSKEQMV